MGDVEHSFEPTARRVRVRFGGVDIADTRRALLMMGGYRPPLYELSNYYFPREDVRTDLLVPSAHRSRCATRGEAMHWTVAAGGREAAADAWSYESPPAGWEGIRGYVAFSWNAMDAWFEEDEEVFVHPRDPHHRVDVLRSSRHVRVRLGGELVAESTRPCLLFETGHADPLLPSARRCAHGSPERDRDAHAVPVQGHRGLLRRDAVAAAATTTSPGRT